MSETTREERALERFMAVFDALNALNVNGHTEKKNVGGKDLTYLSWPWAWAEVKKRYPDAHYEIWKNEQHLPYAYDPATGYIVYTSVTIEGTTHEMWLAVMDGANNAMKAEPYEYTVKNPNFKWAKLDPATGTYKDRYGNVQTEFITKKVDAASMTDINKTIMRCLVKNLAMFGLGLYIYAGEDLPDVETPEPEKVQGGQVDKKTGPENGKVEKADNLPVAPGTYLMKTIAEMAKEFNGFNFNATRKALIESGTVPDIPSATMTMDQAVQLMEAVRAVYETKVS